MSEQPLVELALKHLFQELVAFVSWPSAIAVDKEKLLALDSLDDRLTVHLKSDFVVQVAETPKVVVADEHVNGDAVVHEFGQLALQPYEALGNHCLVFEPKVEQVTH